MNPNTREFEPETKDTPKEWSRFAVGDHVRINNVDFIVENIQTRQLRLRPETRDEAFQRMATMPAETYQQRLERRIREKLQAAKETDYPRGFARPDDEGQTTMQLAHNDKAVLLNFGKPIAWLGFGPEEAEQLAEGLKRHAEQLRAEMKARKPQ